MFINKIKIINSINIVKNQSSFQSCKIINNCSYNNNNIFKREMTTNSNQDNIIEFKGHNEIQIQLMKEECIVVDNDDKPIRPGSKKETHLMVNINNGLLHRAFSIFLFNGEGKLLLQQRALEKITFPGYWTNTVCSHPLWIVDSELKEENAQGVKIAAKRKLNHELGVPLDQVDTNDFTFMTKIHYKSESKEDPQWGEHEIDHILIMQKDGITINAEPNEVMDYKYVSQEELDQLFKDEDEGKVKVTPWFRLIALNHLKPWWNNLNNLKPLVEPTNTIHRY
ncbi:hypothetical protein RB653_009165 [Dictyostelium firmibasis]|uniref:isopentenyl-diphosphate Delta-isomerase n=1 Tax=Dictyostelium firmibasis TaxID=79012 RepID=A0AAN7TUE3_9MYCE